MCTDSEPSLSAVMSERRKLTNLAYRLLGSLADAEDAVQETYARWYAMEPGEREAIRSPGAWLMKVAGRICLDQLKSARARRERYVGEWIPEPLPDGREWEAAPVDPADRITLDESVHMAFMVVLDAMTPAERVAFVLHDVFRYPFAEVAEIVGRTPAACRQLASSARRSIRESRAAASPKGGADTVRRVKEAWEARDVEALIALLDPAVKVIPDSGGRVSASLLPIEGPERIASLFIGFFEEVPHVELLERTVNGQPGLVARLDGAIETVFALDISDDRVTRIWAIRNPEKLASWPTA